MSENKTIAVSTHGNTMANMLILQTIGSEHKSWEALKKSSSMPMLTYSKKKKKKISLYITY